MEIYLFLLLHIFHQLNCAHSEYLLFTNLIS